MSGFGYSGGSSGGGGVDQAAVDAAVAGIVAGAPSALDTLDELAAALGDDANLAATITTALGTKQPLDATLTAFAALAIASGKLPYGSGTDAFSLADLTAAGRALLDDADAAAQLTTLGISTFVKTFLDDADAATARATLGAAATLGAWTDYTPTWTTDTTPPTLGNGTVVGRYKQLDSKTYAIRINFTFGSTSATGTGTWHFSLPDGLTSIAAVQPLAAHINDADVQHYPAIAYVANDTKITQVVPSDSANPRVVGVIPNLPMTWATGDQLDISGIIEVV